MVPCVQNRLPAEDMAASSQQDELGEHVDLATHTKVYAGRHSASMSRQVIRPSLV